MMPCVENTAPMGVMAHVCLHHGEGHIRLYLFCPILFRVFSSRTFLSIVISSLLFSSPSILFSPLFCYIILFFSSPNYLRLVLLLVSPFSSLLIYSPLLVSYPSLLFSALARRCRLVDWSLDAVRRAHCDDGNNGERLSASRGGGRNS